MWRPPEDPSKFCFGIGPKALLRVLLYAWTQGSANCISYSDSRVEPQSIVSRQSDILTWNSVSSPWHGGYRHFLSPWYFVEYKFIFINKVKRKENIITKDNNIRIQWYDNTSKHKSFIFFKNFAFVTGQIDEICKTMILVFSVLPKRVLICLFELGFTACIGWNHHSERESQSRIG